MNNDKYLSVTALTKYLKYKFDVDEHLKTVYLKGEISNFKSHTTGHLYFSIKDENSKINAIMFSANAKKIVFTPIDGMKVLVKGRITIYEATGNYQIYIDEMLEDGVGNLYIAFEQLKEKLSKEGLFDSRFKKKIPKIPSRVGVVTAQTCSSIDNEKSLKDILSTIKRRYPICEVILFPSLVQGEAAASDIVKNIKMAENYDLDVLIVGRGGGSIEDLWPFNEEIVARAIFESSIPIISAVGHEIDYTIADFVADLRAPTPTGAAELAVPNLVDLKKHIGQLKIRLNENVLKVINYQKLYLDSLKNSFVIKNPLIMYDNKKQKLDSIIEKLNNILRIKMDKNIDKLNFLKNSYILKNSDLLYKPKRDDLNNIIEKLELINPLKVLKRGYSVVYKDDFIINSVDNLNKSDKLKIKLSDGNVITKIEELVKDNG